jgi:hypothetical protein
MAKDPIANLKKEVATWAAEMRTLFAACRLLLEYNGSKKELASWDAAVAVPAEWIGMVVAEMPPRTPLDRYPSCEPRGVFKCDKTTAEMIAPLVEIVGGPVAEFVYTIRRTIPKKKQGAFTRAYGAFVCAFADAVTQPLWKTYRHLAPDEWRAAYPEAKS